MRVRVRNRREWGHGEKDKLHKQPVQPRMLMRMCIMMEIATEEERNTRTAEKVIALLKNRKEGNLTAGNDVNLIAR